VHHETTTGRLNSLEGIGELCAKRKVELLVDGVSSFGAEQLEFEGWSISACAATANKCLHGIPGVAFVICRRSALEHSCSPARSLYLNLANYCSKQDEGGTPFTQAVQSFYALDEALRELAEVGGWQSRAKRYLSLAGRVQAHLAAAGIEPEVEPEESSCVLRSYRLPQETTYEELHDGLKERGFVIYAGQGDFQKTLFRVSTMGAISDEDLERLLAAFSEVISKPSA